MLIEFIDTRLQFVADNGKPHPPLLQVTEQLDNTIVETGAFLTMTDVVGLEISKGLLKEWLRSIFWDRPLHQPPHTISHELAHFFQLAFRHPILVQCPVNSGSQILQRIEQRAVEVKNDCLDIQWL